MATTMKRSLQYESETESKRIKIESRSILDFSDCVLLKILSYLKPNDLYCLSKTCQRFKYLISERKLWRKVDVLDHPMCARKFKFFFDNVNNSTDSILVSGISKKEKTLTFSQFIKMNKICDNLTILAIENQYINSDEIGLKDFPESLKELSLRGTHIYGRQPFLQDAHLKLQKLHTLILADCKWFHEHSLMALSKLRSLENLSLYKCANLNDSVAYMSITAKFGFRKLLRIDARCTAIGDQFLKCFHCIKTLREIYLEAPARPRRRGRAPRCSVLDQLQRLAGPPGPSAVVFNRTQLFKMRRDRIKSARKHKKPTILHSQPSRDTSFNCLENCENCTMETCSFIPSQSCDTQSSQSETPNPAKRPYSQNGTASQEVFEVKLRKLHDEEDEEGEESRPTLMNSQMFAEDYETFQRKLMNASRNLETAQPGFDLSLPSSSSSAILEQKASTSEDMETAADAQSSRCSSPEETLYCDDVSDTEDEDDLEEGAEPRRARSVSEALLELEMLQADVSDSGLLWFVGAAPAGADHAGEPSALFRPPYRKHCNCGTTTTTTNNNNKPDNDGAGPSGLKPQPHPQQPQQHHHNDVQLNVSGRGAVRLKITHNNSTSSSSDSDSNSEFENDNQQQQQQQQRQRVRNNDAVEEVYQVFSRQEVRAGRDLRVIIERLDPGVHIVYEHGGGVHRRRRDEHNTTTQLKVFVARGYKLITNQALRSLVDLRLELLDVTGTSVNASGVKEFLMVNPDCRVIHESTCQCGYHP